MSEDFQPKNVKIFRMSHDYFNETMKTQAWPWNHIIEAVFIRFDVLPLKNPQMFDCIVMAPEFPEVKNNKEIPIVPFLWENGKGYVRQKDMMSNNRMNRQVGRKTIEVLRGEAELSLDGIARTVISGDSIRIDFEFNAS